VHPIEFSDHDRATNWFLDERVNLVEAARYAARARYHEYAIYLPHVTHRALRRHGHPDSARTVLSTALASAQHVGDIDAEIATLNDLALVETVLGMDLEARQNFNLAAGLARRHGNDRYIAVTLLHMGDQEIQFGGIDAGFDQYRRSIEISTRIDYKWCTAAAWQRMGEAYRKRKLYQESAECYIEALVTHRHAGNVRGRADTLTDLGLLFHERGKDDQAEDNCRQAVELLGQVGDVETSQKTFLALATVLCGVGKFAEAIGHAQLAAELAGQIHNAQRRARSIEVLAQALWRVGDRTEAARHWQLARGIYHSAGDQQSTQRVDQRIADTNAATAMLPSQQTNPEDSSQRPAGQSTQPLNQPQQSTDPHSDRPNI
jgi:tetratricopeptide (TPR) repeat protein